MLGVCHEAGHGVERDLKEAARLYNQAADFGNAAAINNLGVCYEHSKEGRPKDEAEAGRLYKLSAENGVVTQTMRLLLL